MNALPPVSQKNVQHIYTEPPVNPDTLACLGPLARMAGVWEGVAGEDVKPKADGAHEQGYIGHLELQPIDGQTNGPQLFYGLRYHTFIHKPDQTKMYHDQVGYWLWEPATSTIIQTLTIPRGQIVMAGAQVDPGADRFKISAVMGSPTWGICSNPFLFDAFRTLEYHIEVVFNPDGTWAYTTDTVMQIVGQDTLFHHTDHNVLKRIAAPTPNPLAQTLSGSLTPKGTP